MVYQEKLDLPTLERLADALNEIKIDPEYLANAYRYDFWNYAKLVDDIATGKATIGTEDLGEGVPNLPIPKFLTFKRNRTKQLFAELYREVIAEIPMIRKTAPNTATAKIKNMRGNTVEMLSSGNGHGILIAYNSIPRIAGSITDSYAVLQAKHDLVRLRIAMERYHRTNSQWPASLEALVPEFIPEVPVDPMDGERLRFNTEKRKIYSVGKDFIDNGGKPKMRGQLNDKNEIVIKF